MYIYSLSLSQLGFQILKQQHSRRLIVKPVETWSLKTLQKIANTFPSTCACIICKPITLIPTQMYQLANALHIYSVFWVHAKLTLCKRVSFEKCNITVYYLIRRIKHIWFKFFNHQYMLINISPDSAPKS